VIKSRKMRWAGHVARVGDRRPAYRILVGRPKGRNHLEYLGVDGRIILKLVFNKWDGESWTGLI
jgi:hypothetical protein